MAQQVKTLALRVWRSEFRPQDPGEGEREELTPQSQDLPATLAIPTP